MKRLLMASVAAGLILAAHAVVFGGEAETASSIRAEAVRSNFSKVGRPLPLLGHWNTGMHRNSAGWAPIEQMRMIAKGHHVLPWFHHPSAKAGWPLDSDKAFEAYYREALVKARKLKLPITLICSQWESKLSRKPYLNLPPDKNPNVVGPAGKIVPKVSPFGPVGPWRQIGRSWTAHERMKKLQQWYPDPPRVIFLSNNEHAKLTWHQVHTSKRYLALHGKDKSDDFKRKVVADGWIERYRALQQGLRDGLVSKAWRSNAIFVGYDAFGPPHFGRWGGWPKYSLHSRGRIDPSPLMWDGGSPSYYTHDWNPSADHIVWSPQVQFMNLVFMQRAAHKLNREFWVELSLWDGHGDPPRKKYKSKREVYRSKGHAATPARYAGFAQYGMWLLRPRAVREFRGWIFHSEQGMPYTLAVAAAVDRVHNSATLRAFWRSGELVPNRSAGHPYQANIPAEYKAADRWFLLDADVNPKRPWKLTQDIPVFSLALIRGKPPERNWLVYAHAPMGARKAVKITLPGFGPVTVDVPPAGAFYVADEKTRAVAPVK